LGWSLANENRLLSRKKENAVVRINSEEKYGILPADFHVSISHQIKPLLLPTDKYVRNISTMK
jgi:hypothetical protein